LNDKRTKEQLERQKVLTAEFAKRVKKAEDDANKRGELSKKVIGAAQETTNKVGVKVYR